MDNSLTTIFFKACPRCKGDMHNDYDQYGWYVKCIQCGNVSDLEPPAILRPRVQPGVRERKLIRD